MQEVVGSSPIGSITAKSHRTLGPTDLFTSDSAATRLCKEYGLAPTRMALGHLTVAITWEDSSWLFSTRFTRS